MPQIISTHTEYLPPVSSFLRMAMADEIAIDGEERFQKSSWRNRCNISGSNGNILLSIPLIGGRNVKSPTKDVRIAYDEPWQHVHWNSLQSAYGGSGYFLFYKDLFRPFYEKRIDFLLDLNVQLLQVCFDCLKWEKKISIAKDESSAEGMSLRAERSNLPSPTPIYRQVFEKHFGFQHDLSIVDFIFNEGLEAPLILQSVIS